jgi:eukaryotic-like serine/threonine-protein kinase
MNESADPNRTEPYQPTVVDTPVERPSSAECPKQIDHYRIERLLGKGGFGCVYLAYDLKLQRHVAIKVPHRALVSLPEDAEIYLAEARTAAKLEHPHITQVYYVGSTDEYPFFSVSKFIQGSTLAQKIKDAPPSAREAAELIAIVAETLHYAHSKGVFHRDVKPGNILLDEEGRPYLTDFGLALREEDVGTGWRHVGTPGYMSPEQARGEGHRVDGRADIFSLGVVLYELIVGRRPFRSKEKDLAKAKAELCELVVTYEPRPPRQIKDGIPKELERICLKALSKRAVDRYPTASDMAEELRSFVAQDGCQEPKLETDGNRTPAAPVPESPAITPGSAGGSSSLAPRSASESPPLRIMPKGPRSFDEHDADFFLELLPGPRDRAGVPDSIRFWKTRIEELDPDNAFSVGLMYGPSGCGKTSLMKAGLLPQLSDEVIAIYCEATAGETEVRLLKGLRKHVHGLTRCANLKEAVTALRRGHDMAERQKVLIVLDQFEQWLHANRQVRNSELVQALRQCDGGRVQCIVMVRDDFWLASSRFMRELEIKLIEGQNSALVDLFDLDHARKVLAAFGRAYGRLPETQGEMTREQKDFLKQAVLELARGRRIVCVRLVLFAEMIKDRAWTPATLREVGGTRGVGVTFLEESLGSTTSPPEHRRHQAAAKSLLKALLPESGTDIKGHMRSDADLLNAAGYTSRRQDFEDLIRILNSDLRLITPVNPEDVAAEERRTDSGERKAEPNVAGDTPEGAAAAPPRADVAMADTAKAPQNYYQLTHDYLVPSLRDWLTREQRQSRKGRAELLLADRAAAWEAKPQSRLLPGAWEWLNILLLTSRRDWTSVQKKMMRQARQYYAARGIATAGVLIALAWGVLGYLGRSEARALRDRLLSATIAEVPTVVNDMRPYRRWVNPLLRESRAQAEVHNDGPKLLMTSLALLPADPDQSEYLYERLLDAKPEEFAVIRASLHPHKGELLKRLRAQLTDQTGDADKRFRAACALAEYAPADSSLQEQSFFIVSRLLRENALVLSYWKDALQPIGHNLLSPVDDILKQERADPVQRRMVAQLYIGFAGAAQAERELSSWQAPGVAPRDKVATARRLATIGAALVASSRGEKVWPLLVHSFDPTLRSYLIERLGQAGGEPRLLQQQMERTTDVSVRRALILALGSLDHVSLSGGEQRMLTLYENDSDPGIHGAAGWLLRRWGRQDRVRQVDAQLATGRAEGARRWYVNKQRQTMVIVPVLSQPSKVMSIESDFGIGAFEVTVDDIHRWKNDFKCEKDTAPSGDCPANSISWYQAAEYCNWLSLQEGIPESQWCYLRNSAGKFDKGMMLAPDSLKRTGYRLPTEAEWEFACRALSRTGWSCGEVDAELIGNYAWWSGNSQPAGTMRSFPVGTLKPNDFGLFDMHGNNYEWCHDVVPDASPGPKPNAKPDREATKDGEGRVIRGGSFHQPVRNVRSDSRLVIQPWIFHGASGLRLARTLKGH